MLTIAAKKKHRGIKLNPVERVGMAVVYLICIMAGILTIVPFRVYEIPGRSHYTGNGIYKYYNAGNSKI